MELKSEFPVMVDEKSIVQFSFVQPLVDIYNAWPNVWAFWDCLWMSEIGGEVL